VEPFFFAFLTKIMYAFFFPPVRDLGPTHFILFHLINVVLSGALNITKIIIIIIIIIMEFSQAPSYPFPLKIKYLPNNIILKNNQATLFP